MCRRHWRQFVQDILESIRKVHTYLGNMTYDEFLADGKTQDAVMRNLEVIGEAARHIPEEIRRRYEDVPWAQIVGLRNRLVHGYFVIDPEVIWQICRQDLPLLRTRMEEILKEGT